MKIMFTAAEMVPLIKVGGLADVIGSLPAELVKRGHDVCVVIPRYGFIDYSQYAITPIADNLVVFSLGKYRKMAIESLLVGGMTVYLVGGDIFNRTPSVYGEDEVEKFFVFCDSVCEAMPYLEWGPEIIHCHDWHTALLPLLIRNRYPSCRSVLTIHNVRYQGNFDEYTMHRSGLSRYLQACLSNGPDIPRNFLAQGILWAHKINAVSEGYAREILTPEQGYGMNELLWFRKESLTGIINGLDEKEYDPASDSLIPAPYSTGNMAGKSLDKRDLQNTAGFQPNLDVPVVGMVSRLDEQKGFDIIMQSIPLVLAEIDMQFVFLGTGKDCYERALKDLEARYPYNVRAFITFDERLAHLIYAGSDMFLMPSLWEPCGLSQMIAMRYGTVPVVRKVGGLADTVAELSSDLKKGSGFVFTDYSASALAGALTSAAAAFKKKESWAQVVRRIMQQDFSWKGPAGKYEELYRSAMEMK